MSLMGFPQKSLYGGGWVVWAPSKYILDFLNFAKPLTSRSGNALRALNSVMVLPEPGGPQSTMGLCSASHVYSSDSWRTVSIVGMTTSGVATLWVSTSTWGTLFAHMFHSPCTDGCNIDWLIFHLAIHQQEFIPRMLSVVNCGKKILTTINKIEKQNRLQTFTKVYSVKNSSKNIITAK